MTMSNSAKRSRLSSEQMDLDMLGLDVNRLLSTKENAVDDDDFGDEEYDFAIEHGDQLYDMYEREAFDNQRKIRKSIIERKFFRKPPEVCLLTNAAKQQIRYLHELDPNEWTPRTLSESFPISEEGVKKLLKHCGTRSSKRIQSNDEMVVHNWKQLMDGKEIGLSTLMKDRFMAGKLTPLSAAGNPTLPLPPEKEPKVIERKKTGQFLAIVKPYLDFKKRAALTDGKTEAKSSDNTDKVSVTLGDGKSEAKSSSISNHNVSLTLNPPPHCEADWEITESSRRKWRRPVEISAQRFEENMKRQLSSKKLQTDLDRTILQWLEEKSKKETKPKNEDVSFDSDETYDVPKRIPKYRRRNEIELKVDLNRDGSHSVSYLYDNKFGYQHPYGKLDHSPERIQIPQEQYKEGATYRVGNSFYDDKGELLYKVPLAFPEKNS